MTRQQNNNSLPHEELPKIDSSTEIKPERYSSNLNKLYSAQNDNAYYRKSYIAWDDIDRGNNPQHCTVKKQLLSKSSQAILAVVVQKLRNKDKVFLNHKYISTITRCKRRQNQNIIKELSDILEINYHNSVFYDGRKYRYCYSFSLKKLDKITPSNSSNFDSSIGQFIAHQYYIRENKIINNRSSAQESESNFNNDLISEEGSKENEIISSEETQKASIHVLKSSRPTNKRKKRTKAEVKARKAKVFVFKQYSKKKDLASHYPLSSEDCSKLQVLSGRDFTLNAMNEILLDMSKRVGRLFSSKAQFMAYMAKVYENEQRDAVRTANTGFKIKANQTGESRKELIYEQFLSRVEQQAINHVCPENQLKAKLAGTVSMETAYNLLMRVISFNLVGSVMRIHLRASVELTEAQEGVVLSQVRAVYGDVDDLEFVTEESGGNRGCYGGVVDILENPKPRADSLEPGGGIWGEVCRKIIAKYGEDIYNSWFTKLKVNVNNSTKTIKLNSDSDMIKDWISSKYGDFMSRVAAEIDFKIEYSGY